ncbi:uncharacterized protein BJ171DRAFT_216910 [Polychytrium aggregatum]|uniref:uncharacterized protein n=1 Tax=Polychytrium aggregatum TaxID=110093 RepID=UPI0022FE3488|nr:uncharacterized protein BJ171DRAFT_216910 [Polychytrium aggregatum]KAI9199381.1 hypothetical protein BJ171DRAFT_216910 [Polychytrium aggregatum]
MSLGSVDSGFFLRQCPHRIPNVAGTQDPGEIEDGDCFCDCCHTIQNLHFLLKQKDDELKTAAEYGLDLLSKYQTLESQSQFLANENKEVRLKYEVLKSSHLDAETRISEFQRTNLELLRQNETTSKKLSEAASLVSLLEEKNSILAQTVSEKDVEVSKLKKNLGYLPLLESTKHDLQGRLDSLFYQITEGRVREASYRRKISRMAARCNELEILLEQSKDEGSALKEANEQIQRVRVNRNPYSPGPSPTVSEAQSDQDNQALFSLVKELTLMNNKLKTELAESKELLDMSRNEITALRSSMEIVKSPVATSGPISATPRGRSVFGELESYVLSTSLQKLARESRMLQRSKSDGGTGKRRKNRDRKVSDELSIDTFDQMSISSDAIDDTSHSDEWDISSASDHDFSTTRRPSPLRGSPVIAGTQSMRSSSQLNPRTRSERTKSQPSAISNRLPSSVYIYLRTLQSTAHHIHGRFRHADTVSLNRRLKRQFDLNELSRLSNNVLENIMTEVENLSSRFPVPTAKSSSETLKPPTDGGSPAKSKLANASIASEAGTEGKDEVSAVVAPLVELIQALLMDIGYLRISLNHYALVYFEKVVEKSAETTTEKQPEQPSQHSSSSDLFSKWIYRSWGKASHDDAGGKLARQNSAEPDAKSPLARTKSAKKLEGVSPVAAALFAKSPVYSHSEPSLVAPSASHSVPPAASSSDPGALPTRQPHASVSATVLVSAEPPARSVAPPETVQAVLARALPTRARTPPVWQPSDSPSMNRTPSKDTAWKDGVMSITGKLWPSK